MVEVRLVMGYPASGKTSLVEKEYPTHARLNRDTEGGTILGLLPKLDALLSQGKNVVLDNLFAKAETRAPFITMAKKHGATASCTVMETSIEDAQFNAAKRMLALTGKLLSADELAATKHPNLFPPAVLFKYKKDVQPPSLDEGLFEVVRHHFQRQDDPSFTNRAVIFDFDGTLRECRGGNGKYPTQKEHVQVLAGRGEVLKEHAYKGYLLLGASNQSGVSKGELTHQTAERLFDFTTAELGVGLLFAETAFCPHQAAPPSCFCRKPMPGMGVHLIMKYKLDRKRCIYVGNQTSDKTFASRCGFQYIDHKEFFK